MLTKLETKEIESSGLTNIHFALLYSIKRLIGDEIEFLVWRTVFVPILDTVEEFLKC